MERTPAEVVQMAAPHRAELVARARRELGPFAASAEDVVQDAYLHLLRRARQDTAPLRVRPWLHTVVRSLCAEERRRREREQPSTALEAVPTLGLDPHERATAIAETRWLFGRIAALPQRERQAVLGTLTGVRGGPGANALHQALHRGRTRLRAAREAAWTALIPLRIWLGGGGLPPVPTPTGGGGRIAAALAVAAASVVGVVGTSGLGHSSPRHEVARAAAAASAPLIGPSHTSLLSAPAVTAPARQPTTVSSDAGDRHATLRSDGEAHRRGEGGQGRRGDRRDRSGDQTVASESPATPSDGGQGGWDGGGRDGHGGRSIEQGSGALSAPAPSADESPALASTVAPDQPAAPTGSPAPRQLAEWNGGDSHGGPSADGGGPAGAAPSGDQAPRASGDGAGD